MTGKTMHDRFYELKEKSRKGCKINSIEALLAEEFVYLRGIFLPVFALYTFGYETVLNYLKTASLNYAFPTGTYEIRFTDDDVIYIEKRLKWQRTIENRAEIIRILHEYDRGVGDVDDVIDEYENDYLEHINCEDF
ncbi:MAG: hypothetical protein K1W18_07200 [Oscillospiraceae bacterium]